MNRNNTPTVVLLATLGAAILAILGLCALFLVVILPRVRRSALEDPANPNLTVAEYNRRGNEMYRQGLFKRAATEYGYMIKKEPNKPDGYMLRGMTEAQAGDYKRAVQDDTEGLKYARNAEMRDAFFFNRGLAYRNMGSHAKAVPDLSQALALNRQNWDAYEVRAFCYTSLQDYDRAIADYTVAIEHNPHPGTVFERGQAYMGKKEYQQALADFDRSLKARPNFVAGYRLRADAYVALKQFDQAATDAATVLKMENTAQNRGNLGWYQYLAGKLPESIENSQAAIKMDPNLTFARFNLGLCYAVQGDAPLMQSAYQDAIQHAKAADLQGALKDVKEALNKQPNSPTLKQAETLLQDAPPPSAAP